MTHRRILAGIILVYLLLAAGMSVIVPLGESPDEVDHFAYIHFLARERRLPVMQPAAAENETMEANQPPLFYALNAVLLGPLLQVDWSEPARNGCFSFDPADPGRQTFYRHAPEEAFPYRGLVLAFHLSRLLSVLLGVLTIASAYAISREIDSLPLRSEAGLMAAAAIALNPQFLFISASVNNDVLTAALGGLIVLWTLKCWRRPAAGRFAGLGLLLGLGFLTKFALFAFWPLALAAALLAAGGRARRPVEFLAPKTLWAALKTGWPAAVVPVLTAGWLYLRNWQLYGDPLVWAVHLQAKGEQVLRSVPPGAADYLEFVSVHFRSFWALFGWLNVAPPFWIYGFYAVLTLAAAAGVAHRLGSSGRDRVERARLLLLLGAVGVIYLSLLRYIQTINWSGYQGRLAFAAVAPIGVLLGIGLERAAGRFGRRRRLVLATAVLALAWSAGVLLFAVVAPAYPRPGIYTLPPQVASVCARFASGVMIDGVALEGEAVPGGEVRGTWYLFGLAEGVEAAVLQTRVWLPAGRFAAARESDLTLAGGEGGAQPFALPLPADLEQPTVAYLEVSVLEDGAPLPATSAGGRLLEPLLLLQEFKIVDPRALPPDPTYPLDSPITFGGRLRLLGLDLETKADPWRVRLVWEAVDEMEIAYTTFVHLLDSGGERLGQQDGQPQDGRYPTRVWDAGERVSDEKIIARPAAEVVRLAIGVYDGLTEKRLPIGLSGEDLLLIDLAALEAREP